MMPADAKPLCADNLPLSAATPRSDTDARLCRRCPVAAACQQHLLASPEWGTWGGTRRLMKSGLGAGPGNRLKVVA